MREPAGFFCFRHENDKSLGGLSIAFAFKAVGSVRTAVLDELILSLCRGPVLPDAIVIASLACEPGTKFAEQAESETAKEAYQRTSGKIPIIHASIDLASGKILTNVLCGENSTATAKATRCAQRKAGDWVRSGLDSALAKPSIVLSAPPGYVYENPSGKRSEIFLKPDLALNSSSVIGFVAVAIFLKFFSKRRFNELTTIFVDTMAVAPVAYSLRELFGFMKHTELLSIDSFHSYAGFDEIERPLGGTSFCIISASTSMSLHERWVNEKRVSRNEVVTLVTVANVGDKSEGALVKLAAIDAPYTMRRARKSSKIEGETFMPSQEPAKRVTLSVPVHRPEEDLRYFHEFAGKKVFDVYRRPPRSSKARAIFVDGSNLIRQDEFKDWLEQHLYLCAKASAKVVIYQDDDSSRELARRVTDFYRDFLNGTELAQISASSLASHEIDEWAGVIVCAAVVGKGSMLLETSRGLRDKHRGPRLFLIGFQVSDEFAEVASLSSNLRQADPVNHDVLRFGHAAVGTSVVESFEAEYSKFYRSPMTSTPRGVISDRGRKLGGAEEIGSLALLPSGPRLAGRLALSKGFAFWPSGYQAQACQAEVIATMAVVLQRARESVKIPEEKRLATSSFRQVLLDPTNFTRYNDGVIQAAILRCAHPSEIDYRGDYAASDFMRAVLVRAVQNASSESGEGALEFLLAFSMGRLQLEDSHAAEVRSVSARLLAKRGALASAADFICSQPEASSVGNESSPI